MRVGFLQVGQDTRLARMMVRSCLDRGYELIQMTDPHTPAIDGCEVVRRDWDGIKLMTYRMAHLADLNEPDLCVLDTDTIVQRDLSDVWGDWDLALTKRGPTFDPSGVDVSIDMPFNIGVMFVRDPKVWVYARDYCARLPHELQRWWGDQLAMKAAADRFRLCALDCKEWNYTPASPEEVSDARVLHFKGPRKAWMLANYAALL